ncbi:MAG: hypothetical protein N2484_17010 [Clostridia bacterium]|nr:hypothetical protein [Clostridia bacterium]
MPFGFERREFEKNMSEFADDTTRQYLEVTAMTLTDGRIIPLSFIWEDREIKINKVLECRQGKSLKHGAQGLRYQCRVGTKSFYLYFENNRWSIEL